MRVLFIDLAFHKKTKSADFFLNLLRSRFEVETLYYDEMYKVSVPKQLLDHADLVVVWQALLARNEFVPAGKPCVYVPMYDSLWGSRAQWRRIARSGTKVLSFCDKVSALARRGGIAPENLLDVRYAFDPDAFSDAAGDPDVLAVWDRGFFGFPEVKRLFPAGFFRKVILIRRPQPGLVFAPISERDRRDYNLRVLGGEFLPREDYLALQKEPGVYLAPRPKEGIGMAFLEQLAMGKCVIVHDDGTMNEYVRDGENGFVRNFYGEHLAPISHEDIARVRRAIAGRSRQDYARWQADKEKILPFLETAMSGGTVRFGGCVDSFLRGAYLVEAALNRILN